MDQGDDLPPPYSAGPSTTTAPVLPFAPLPHTSSPSSSSSSSLFTHHLSNLRSQILAEQAARASDRDMSDARLLALLVPCVEELLSSIATVHPPPRLVEAALVPASAVGPDWHFSDQDERRDGELRTVMRVDSDVKGGDTKTAARDGRDGRDGHGLWWGDEDTARRLAKCLNPEGPVPTNLERLAVRAHVKEAKRASRWGLFRRDEPPPPPPPASQHGASPSAAAAAAASRAGEDVVMTVDADEVTFRRESEMGIWESRTGWGIVVRVRIRSGHI